MSFTDAGNGSAGAPVEGADSRRKGYAAKIRLRSSEFRKKREDAWRELESFITKAEKRGIKSLPANDLQRLPVLYRSALSSLSVARSIALDRNLLIFLENLTLRAFLVVYGPRTGLLKATAGFFARDLPAAVRAGAWHFAIAFVALMVGVAAGFQLVQMDPSWFDAFVPRGLAGMRGPSATREMLLSSIFAPYPGFVESFGAFSNYLFKHNSMVGLLTFCLAFAAGIPTIMLTTYQGVILGAFIAVHYKHSLTVDFLGWISIHGVTEITAILLCCAAGLMIADKLLFPGRYSRMEALRQGGNTAALIMLGAFFMLVIAAILEGGFRQLIADTPARYAVGATTGALWLSYFLLGGRREARQ